MRADDGSVVEAALREAQEEIGLDTAAVEVLGLFHDVPTTVTNFVITPVLALARTEPRFRPDGREIERVLEIPLAHLLEPTSFREEEWEREGVKRAVVFVSYGEDVVWGTTGASCARCSTRSSRSCEHARGEVLVSYETLLVEAADGVGTITLNRPEARNALNPTVVRELAEALDRLETDPDTRVVVLRGAGERAFCAGADLKGMFGTASILEARDQYAGVARVLETIPRMRTPVIAQVHGFALAGGCGLAAACDLVIAAEDAVFGLPEVKVGLLPLMVLAPILRAASPKRVLELILTGRELPAREALEIGLVTRVVPRVELEETVGRIARSLAALVPGHGGSRQGGLLPSAGASARAGACAPARPPDHRRALRGRPGGDRGVPGEAPTALARTLTGRRAAQRERAPGRVGGRRLRATRGRGSAVRRGSSRARSGSPAAGAGAVADE